MIIVIMLCNVRVRVCVSSVSLANSRPLELVSFWTQCDYTIMHIIINGITIFNVESVMCTFLLCASLTVYGSRPLLLH